MRNDESNPGASSAKGEGSPADGSRRAFVKRAALVGLPVVLATIPSRTVWAKPKKTAGAAGDPAGDPPPDTHVPSATHSSALGNIDLFPHA